MSNILGEMSEGWIPSDFNESGYETCYCGRCHRVLIQQEKSY